MKIVIATGIHPPDIGGPATFVPMAARTWFDAGNEIEIVTYSDVPERPSAPFDVRRVMRTLPLPLRYVQFFWKVWRASKGARTVFAQDGVASGFPAWMAARLRGARFVVKVVGDFAWEHARVQDGYAGTLEGFQNDHSLSPRIETMRKMQKSTVRRADQVIVPSRFLADLVKSWGVDEKKIKVIYNGVDVPASHPRESGGPGMDSRFRGNGKRILSAGRLVSWKGFETLIKALAEVRKSIPNADLVIVGDGPDEQKLRDLAKSLGVADVVRFTGRLSREELWKELRQAGIFALVSSYEGFSHQLVEAAKAGAAIVASNAGGNPELVKDDQNGLLVPYGDVAATAQALKRMMNESGLAERLGTKALEDSAVFSTERQMKDTTDAVLGRPGLRVVMVSRDGSFADRDSRGAARMRLYGDRVDELEIVVLARRAATALRLSDRIGVTIIDVRDPLTAEFTAFRAVSAAITRIGANLLTAQDPFEAGFAGLAAARLAGIPTIIEEHGGFYLNPHWKEEAWKNRLLSRPGLWALGRADALRVVSARTAADMAKRFPGKTIREIPVSTEKVPCLSSNIEYDFGYIGRFVPQKNLEGLLAAFRKVVNVNRDAKLLMLGGGPLEQDLKRLAAEYTLSENIIWKPFTEDVASAYASIGSLVLPSWYEGWGRVVIEAMQCGVPVIMTDVGCAGEVLRDGVEGRVVPVGDTEAFAQAMLSSLEPMAHASWSNAARIRAGQSPTVERVADEVTGFWREIAAGKKSETEVKPDGHIRPRVVMISRDPMAADPQSFVTERLDRYAQDVENLHVVVLGRRDAMPVTKIRSFTVEVVDVRRGIVSLLSLYRRARAAIEERKANLVVTQDSFEAGLIGLLAAAPTKAKVIVEDHGAWYVSPVWRREAVVNRFRWLLGLVTPRFASGVRVENHRQKRIYRRQGVKTPIVVAPLGMDMPSEPLPFRDRQPSFLFGGRFVPDKNVPMLLRAFLAVHREFPGTRLYLIGSGEQENEIRAMVRELGLDGAVDVRPWARDLREVYGLADVVVVPSNRECWPRFPLESMAYGVPVIMTAVGNAGDMVRDGIEGRVVPIYGENEMIQAMRELAASPETRRRMREAGIERAKLIPSSEEVIVRVSDFWKRIVNSK